MVLIWEVLYIFAEIFFPMRINEALDVIAEIFEYTFGLLRVLGDNFNWVIISVIAIIGIIWVRAMVMYNREAEQNGTLK